ncbi:MAG: PQQ-binding-like beta-propeller repeat protein [Candidatus Nealsonbacteria bacterium]|nr:PQQ-binding-like beta-propeller repeat protein [Candidatus Nealsonbacteria bacterium]
MNLLVAEGLGQVAMEEVMRVLCPGGVAYLKKGDTWTKTVKPRPHQIDEWTHYLHGPDNNAVAHDSQIDVPRRLRWLGQPKFARAHEQLASMGACVTTGGRIFYIIDETPRADVRFPSKWALVARDAFNGVVLWKRPVRDWVDQLRRFRSGPSETAFRLAACDDRVYVTLGIDAPVSILDAVTGRTVAACENTANARQVLRIGEQLVVLVDTGPQGNEAGDAQIRRGAASAPGARAIVAADAATGKTLWRTEIDAFVHPTLAARDGRLFYQTGETLFCLDLGTGRPLWQVEAKMQLTGHEAGWESPTLVAGEAIVYCADFKRLTAYDARDGSVLWSGPAMAGYNSPPDVFLTGGLLWTRRKGMVGLDPATGEIKKEIPTVGGYMHHRCYRNKATDRFALLGLQGVQFVDFDSDDVSIHHWIRGTCQYGILPANGLLYVTPDSCACNMKTKLAGLWALAGARGEGRGVRGEGEETAGRLQRGPAFGQIPNPKSQIPNPSSWPVYRHDAARSGMTGANVPATLKRAWHVPLGGKLSGVTVAGGKVFVASVDTHTVHALDEQTGETVWTFTAGGRIDSPPTIYRGRALFGSADGTVYAVRAADGKLAWRFRAAPDDRRTFVNGQLESVWPVHGSVLVNHGKLIVAAGRSSYLDGGIRLYELDPDTGRMLSETAMYSPDGETGKQPTGGDGKDVRGVISDILLADAGDVYMRHVKLDLATGDQTGSGVHLFSPIGLLDDTWWHRGYWVMHDQFTAHWSGWWKVGNVVPSGRILSYDKASIFGYGRDKYPGGNTGQWRGGERYQLFACNYPGTGPKPAPPKVAEPKPPKKGQRAKRPAPPAQQYRWTVQLPFYVRAMVVADETMFIAGPPELTQTKGLGEGALVLANPDDALAAWQGAKGGHLWAVSTKDGRKLAEYKLDVPPVFDGMAAVAGRLYLTLKDGSIVCYVGQGLP